MGVQMYDVDIRSDIMQALDTIITTRTFTSTTPCGVYKPDRHTAPSIQKPK